MTLRSTRWLIEACVAFRPAGQFLQLFETGDIAWSPDKTRALRFKTRHEAEGFGRSRMALDVVASEHATGALVARPDRDAVPACAI